MVDVSRQLPAIGELFALWDGSPLVVKRIETVRRDWPPALRQSRRCAPGLLRRRGSHCTQGRVDNQPGLSRVADPCARKVPNTDTGPSDGRNSVAPCARFAVREQAETAADKANGGKGYTDDPVALLRAEAIGARGDRPAKDQNIHYVDPPVLCSRSGPRRAWPPLADVSGRQVLE